MKTHHVGWLVFFLVLGQVSQAQFLISGSNLFASAKFTTPGIDSSSFVVGEFLTYEVVVDSTPNITSYLMEMGDSIATADSCGQTHYTNKMFVAKISKTGTVDWIRISNSCDTVSKFQLIEISTDIQQNLFVLGMFQTNIELENANLSTNAEWDMFLYKISPNGDIIWNKNGFALGDTSAVIPRDMQTIGNELYISGSYYGAAKFDDDTLTTHNQQFFLLNLNESGDIIKLTTGLPLSEQSTSLLNDIDFTSDNDIAGILSAKGTFYVGSKLQGMPIDTLLEYRGGDMDVLYSIDSTDINQVLSVVDSFYVNYPADTIIVAPDTTYIPETDSLFYLVYYDSIVNKSIIIDSIYRANSFVPTLQNYLFSYTGTDFTLVNTLPQVPVEFLIDRNNNNKMYALHNYDADLAFGNDTVYASNYSATALINYNLNGGIDGFKTGFSMTDTVEGTSFCIDPTSNIYVAGSVGKQVGNHVLNFDGTLFSPTYDEDCFIVKLEAGAVAWGQILGDSAADQINDIYALDRFTIIGAGNYAHNISYDKFSINTSGKQDLFIGALDPFPAFDFKLISFFDENLPLCEGDSTLLVAQSSHNCNIFWMKDSVQIAGAVNDSLWVFDNGSYFAQAASSVIKHDDLSPYTKKSESFAFEFTAYPNDSIAIFGATTFCEGEDALLTIAITDSDTCNWYNLADGELNSFNYIRVLQSGDYYAQIEGETGCISISDTVKITAIAPPSDSIAILGGNNMFCSGDSLQIESYATGINSYVWYRNGDSLTSKENPIIAFQNEGIYSVDILNSHNCLTQVDSLILVEIIPPNLQSWFADGEAGICMGDSSEIRMSQHDATEYYWFYNNDSIKNFSATSYYANNMGDYRVTVLKNGVCEVHSDTFSLVVNPLPLASLKINGDSIICDNETTQLLVEIDENKTLSWFRNGEILTGSVNDTLSINQNGLYYAEIINEFGCSVNSRSLPILVKRAPNLSLISENHKTLFCLDDSLYLSIENPGALNYQWQRDGNALNISTFEYYASQSGAYAVLLTDTAINCSAFTNILQIEEVLPPDNTLDFQLNTPLCDRDTILLTSNAKNANYAWYLNEEHLTLKKDRSFKAYKNGSYYLRVSDTNNCFAFSTPINLNFLTNSIPPIQQDGKYLSTLLFNEVLWYKDNIAISGAQEQVYLVNESGNYFVEVKHENGCYAASPEIQVCVPFPKITVNRNEITASTGVDYQWFYGTDTIFGANQIKYIAQLSGAYSVDITLADNCVSRSDEVNVCYPIPSIELEPNNVLKASLGLAYQWYLNEGIIEGADARLYVATKDGNYKVEVLNLDNCMAFSDPIYVTGTAIRDINPTAIQIYPNPFIDKINVMLPQNFDYTDARIKIINTLGIVVFEKEIETNPEFIPLPNLQSGWYEAVVATDNKKIHKILICK